MACHIINYDLRKPQRDYDKLYEAIKSYSTWAHILESTWIVESERNSEEVRDHLKKHMDADDGIVVVRLGEEGAWSGLRGEGLNDWLQKAFSLR